MPYARALAIRRGGTLLLVSVVDIPVEFNAFVTAAAAGDQLDVWLEERRAYLMQLAAGIADVRADTRVELGSAALGIADTVRATSNPLVVMATHGRTGIRRFVV